MDYDRSGKSPKILQLHKWNPSEFQLNLSDFREAFISPTRELLLLLSYQSEALLLSLVRGAASSENSQSREDDCLVSSREPSVQKLKDDLPGSSISTSCCDNGLSHELEFSKFHGYPFISDVDSIAWGICGDTYNQHVDSLFRELLFVCGSHSVTVHAFCKPEKTTHPPPSVDFVKGKWVDWGPSSPLDNKANEHEFCVDDTAAGLAANSNNGNKEFPGDMCKETEFNESSGGVASKRWLQSFYVKAETIKSDGSIWTSFPKNSSFPCSGKIVSFSIFEDFPFLDLLSSVNSLPSTDESHLETDRVVNKSDSFSNNSLGSYKCSRVFSSHSNCLVGFYLTLADYISFDRIDEKQGNRIKNVLLVGRVGNSGIQWISAVELAEKENVNPSIEWTDFCFSDNLLVCLNRSGFIYFYASMTGEYVLHLDILQACGLNSHPRIRLKGKFSLVSEMQVNQSELVHDDSISECGDLLRKRMFKKLLCASNTSLLAAVDEYGVTYVINAARYLPHTYYSNEKLFQHFEHLEQGMLFGWKVAALDVSHQRGHDDCNGTSLSSQIGNHHGKGTEVGLPLSGFSATKRLAAVKLVTSEVNSQLMKKVFLPIEKFGEDDVICFSPLGVTRLIKQRNAKNQKSDSIVHFNLHADSEARDDRCINSAVKMLYQQGKEETSVGEAIGCDFHGLLYLVTNVGISVVLPSISISSNFLPVENIGYRQHDVGKTLEIYQVKEMFAAWKVEILDRILVHEGPEEADRICLENGWDLRISRLRHLQLALDYLKYDEIEQSLEMLVVVDLAEEGILRVVLAAVYLMFCTKGNDSEFSASSRLLALASCFTTKVIRKCGLLKHKRGSSLLQGSKRTLLLTLSPVSQEEGKNEMREMKRLHELAHFLEIIRELQYQLSKKFKKPGQGLVDGEEALMLDSALPQDETQLALPSNSALPSDTVNQQGILNSAPSIGSAHTLASKDSLDSKSPLDVGAMNEVMDLVPQNGNLGKRVFPLENPKEMIARWKLDNLDLKNVVKDALHSGRLPLAVLQLHLHRSVDLVGDEETPDTFSEVRDVGRAIAYDLFLKGEIGLAVATLQRLGEDVEICLKQLLFGTVRRSLRSQVAEEIKKYSYLGPYEWKLLQKISLVERLYPSSSFWRTYHGRQKELMRPILNSPESFKLELLSFHLSGNFTVECDEIDGVVLGSWQSVNENSPEPAVDEDTAHAGYWAGAAVWASAWDQRTFDCIVLDQPFLMGVHVLWESQLEYYLCHNEWEEVTKLLDLIPSSLLFDGNLQVSLDGSQQTRPVGHSSEILEYGNYICSIEELDAVYMDVPGVKLFGLPVNLICSAWLQMLMEQELAKKFIFMKEYWESPSEIVFLLARSGFITRRCNELAIEDDSSTSLNISDAGRCSANTVQALHQLFVHHCVQYNLPNFLDIYLDHQKLALDDNSLCSLLEAAGECHWAKWLLLSRTKGHEYEASFCNARSVMSCNTIPDSNLSALEVDEIIHTVDDIAEGGGEMAALATLMYAPEPIQNCLSEGGVNRHGRSSAQCTLENLKPTLQHFPTVWRTLISASIGQDTTLNFVTKTNNELSDYLNWRDNIFFSSARDTSLLQMLPYCFPKAIRRLIQLYIQGPLGWQSLTGLPTGDSLLHRNVEFYIHAEDQTAIGSISWEATIQKHIREELYDSSLEENGLGLEHHLHRGRPLAAFNHILGVRVQKFRMGEQSVSSRLGQTNVQADVQTLLSTLTASEETLLSSVIPLAIIHFEDSVLVASCAFLLELCGLSASVLRVDVAALRRISPFYKNSENEKYNHIAQMGSAFYPVSHEGDVVEFLARTLADEYLHKDFSSVNKLNAASVSLMGKQPSRALMLVLQHLEKTSLSLVIGSNTCGSWLATGQGDGGELRSIQKAASEHWNLVSVFCQMHQLPPSTKYLAFLARDNDWVGFLSEAHIGGYPFETVVQVASKEFSDPRLKIHILTVLRSMQSRRKAGSSVSSNNTEKRSDSYLEENVLVPSELFRILADCERQKNSGEALLRKAKEMSWSLLAMTASCFPDVSPLDCLTVWLEITAARETSSIKVNDTASQIADNVGAAVEATNSLPAGARDIAFHYNRQNPKRRRLIETISLIPLVNPSDVSSNAPANDLVQHGFAEDERKVKAGQNINSLCDSEGPGSLSKMVAVLCEQHLFLPLLRAFEIFLPSCSLLPFIRALQAYSQMRLSEASAHLDSFSGRINDEPSNLPSTGKEGKIEVSWIISTAVKAANAVLSASPSPYEKRCLLQLLAATNFGDGGSAAAYYRKLYWKINIAEPLLRMDDGIHLGNETLDDDALLLSALERSGYWEQAHDWAMQLEASGGPWKSAVHHVTETQAESMVEEWKEFLWDVPEERVALWDHCQRLFIRHSLPALQAGSFFLRHAENVGKDLPPKELHELLLLSLQWLSGVMTACNPVYPMHLLRELETRVWLLAVESEAHVKSGGDFTSTSGSRDPVIGNPSSIIEKTAHIIAKMDSHINATRNRIAEKHDTRENNIVNNKNQVLDASTSAAGGNAKMKKKTKGYMPSSRRPSVDSIEKTTDSEDGASPFVLKNDLQDENLKMEMTFSKWEERVGAAELERAVLSLLEFGQITAAKQLQHKLSPTHAPPEFKLVNAALKLAALSTPSRKISISVLDEEVHSVVQTYNLPSDRNLVDPIQALDSLATIFSDGNGRGLCKRIIAVVKAANVLGLSFSEAFEKQPIELLQLLSLKAQESFEEAHLLMQTHSLPPASIAQILAESFLKGLLAAHRGGYMDSQKEEGPAPLLWRFSDFLKWAELCPSEPEIGHALMRLVITGQEIPHACEVELLILSHHFYKSSACLDGVDVLVALAATRVDVYVSEGDFACLARLMTGVGNFHALNFILGILIENGQLDLLLQKYSTAADANAGTAEAVRGFRMAVLTSLKQFNPNDLDAFALVYNHFDMKHETAALLESRAMQSSEQWFRRYDKDHNEDLLESMRYFIEAAEVHSSIDAGNKTRKACAQASLVSLQIRMPDSRWLNLSETNARRLLVEQSRFQEALIVAEAYGLNQASEWALVLWNQMLKPELTEEFVAEFVAVLPLQPSMLIELARFYRAEVAARGDQSQFSVWLTGGGLPAEWAKYLGRSFRCLLKRTRDLRLRLQLATIATGFTDIIDACAKAIDRVPENAGPLVLRKGHGGAYLPLM